MLEAVARLLPGVARPGGAGTRRTSAELAAAQKKATEIFTELSAFLRFVHALAPERLLWESSVREELAISGDELSAAQAGGVPVVQRGASRGHPTAGRSGATTSAA